MPYPLPIAFLSSPSILTWQDTGNPFLNQETLVNSLSGGNTRFFTPVSFENVDTYCQNMETLIIDNVIYYQHIADAAINGIVRYTLTAPTGDRLYGYIPLGSPQVLDTTTATLNVIPSPFTLPYYLSMQTIAEAPVNEDGQPALEIDLVGGPHFDTAVSDVYLYTYDSSAISDTYAALSAGAMQITSWKDGCLSGTVTADAAHPILFTTIPYDKGWTASIDDQPIQVNGILNDTFICLYLPEGTHTITLQYEDPFAAPGAMISVVCAVFFLLLVLLAYRKAHPAAAKNAAAKSSVAESDKEKTDEE